MSKYSILLIFLSNLVSMITLTIISVTNLSFFHLDYFINGDQEKLKMNIFDVLFIFLGTVCIFIFELCICQHIHINLFRIITVI